MRVHVIEAQGFMSHDESTVKLPQRGTVLLTGANGAGKSSLVEAVAMGLWGKSLRGTTPWREGNGYVRIETDRVLATRTRRPGRTALGWATRAGMYGPGDFADTAEYESTSKAQEALEEVVGTLDLWRRTHVFSSADASHFTLATDGERKRLLERLLGLERFDEALERCRADRQATSDHLALTQQRRSRLEVERVATQGRLDEAEAHMSTLGPTQATCDTDLDKLQRLIAAYDADLRALRQRSREANTVAVRAEAAYDQARRALAAFRGGVCGTCKEPVPPARYNALQAEAHTAEVDAHDARSRADKELAAIVVETEEMEQERASLAHLVSGAASRAAAAAAYEATRKRLTGIVSTAQLYLENLDEQIALVAAVERTDTEALAELMATERVLGLKGVRAHVLGRALSGLEVCANAWLARITGASLKLRLRSYAEKKTGGVTDAIGLEVEGAGGGHGYKASSGGERRRIDVALLMALAEVAQAAHGQEPGTLFFDEVFDALDADGVDAVARALGDLSRDRAVVVISHSPQLAAKLDCVERLHVADGRVARVGS